MSGGERNPAQPGSSRSQVIGVHAGVRRAWTWCRMELSASVSAFVPLHGLHPQAGGAHTVTEAAPGSRLTACLLQWSQSNPGAGSSWLTRALCPLPNKSPWPGEWGTLMAEARLACSFSGGSGWVAPIGRGLRAEWAKPRGGQSHWSGSPGQVAELRVPSHQP